MKDTLEGLMLSLKTEISSVQVNYTSAESRRVTVGFPVTRGRQKERSSKSRIIQTLHQAFTKVLELNRDPPSYIEFEVRRPESYSVNPWEDLPIQRKPIEPHPNDRIWDVTVQFGTKGDEDIAELTKGLNKRPGEIYSI